MQRKRLALIALAVVLFMAAVAIWVLPVKPAILAIFGWVKSLGAWGPVLLVVIYVVACLLFLPVWFFSLGAGFLFGVPLGVATISVSATLASVAAFVVGKRFLREWVRQRLARNKVIGALDQAVEQQGLWVVFLLRLSPLVPFSVQNYALGLTGIGFWKYTLASWLGMLPGIFLYVYLGSAARSLASLSLVPAKSGWGEVIFWVGLATTLAAIVLVARRTQRQLEQKISGPGSKN